MAERLTRKYHRTVMCADRRCVFQLNAEKRHTQYIANEWLYALFVVFRADDVAEEPTGRKKGSKKTGAAASSEGKKGGSGRDSTGSADKEKKGKCVLL